MRMLESALCQHVEFKQEEGIHHQLGGKEHVLLNYRDGGVRFILLDIFNPTWPKGHYCRNVGHAMIHVARPMPNIPKEHVGFLIDNQEDVDITFIKESDTATKEDSRKTLCKFFGGAFLKVQIKHFYLLRSKQQ